MSEFYRMQKFLVLFLFLSNTLWAQNGYNIKVTFKPYTKGKLYLCFHYGKRQMLLDSATLNGKSEVVFSGPEKLQGGIYLIVNPQKSQLFEFLLDKYQQFSVYADSTDLLNKTSFEGSPENDLFMTYQKESARSFQRVKKLQEEKDASPEKAGELDKQINSVNKKMQDWREQFIRDHPESMLTALFWLLKEPEYPAPVKRADGKADSASSFYVYRSHYWDGVNFADDRLLRTPMFEPKLQRYFDQLVPPAPDSIEPQVDRMILSSRTNRNMFKYFITKFTNDYIQPKYMGQDAVFLHLFEKYFLTGQVDWLDEKVRKQIYDRAYSIMANIIGDKAADLKLRDTTDRELTLYSVNAHYTILCFWDPDCGHCREEVPKIDSMYHVKWKSSGVKIVGVLVDSLRMDHPQNFYKMDDIKANWINYIREHGLDSWVNVYISPLSRLDDYHAQRPSFRQLYDVYQTPTLYLLDKDKRIVGKKLTWQQIDELLDYKLKNVNPPKP